MTGNVRQTAQEPMCRPIVAAHEQDTASDGTWPQNAPEGTVDMAEYVMERAIIAMWRSGVPSSHIARRLNVPRREVNRIIRRQVRHG